VLRLISFISIAEYHCLRKKRFKNDFKMYLNHLLIHIIRWNNYLNKNGDPKLRGKLVPKMSPGTFLLVPIYFSGTFLVVPKSFKRLVMGPVWWSLLQWFPSEVEHSSTKINWIPVLLKFLIDTNNLDLFVIRKLIFFFIKKRIT
jgi:hypothetical protein